MVNHNLLITSDSDPRRPQLRLKLWNDGISSAWTPTEQLTQEGQAELDGTV